MIMKSASSSMLSSSQQTATPTSTTLLRGEITAVLDISLPALGTSHDDNEGGEHKHVIVESKTDTPTTLLRGETTATLVT